MLLYQSRLHSRSGRRLAMVLAKTRLPAATINAIVQLLVPPPKYHVDRLVPDVQLAPEATPRRNDRHPARRRGGRRRSPARTRSTSSWRTARTPSGSRPTPRSSPSSARGTGAISARRSGPRSRAPWRGAHDAPEERDDGLADASSDSSGGANGSGQRWTAIGTRPLKRRSQRSGASSPGRGRAGGSALRTEAVASTRVASADRDRWRSRPGCASGSSTRRVQQRRGRLRGPGGRDRRRSGARRASSRSFRAHPLLFQTLLSVGFRLQPATIGFGRLVGRAARGGHGLPGLRARARCLVRAAGGR